MIAHDDEIPLTTATVMARWKWFYVGLGVSIIAVMGRVGFNGGAWSVLVLASFLLVPIAGANRAYRYEKVLRDPRIAERVQKYRTFRSWDFTEACRRIEEDGFLLNSKKVFMASPLTWGRKQGLMHYRCDPFEIFVYEKNGRVGGLNFLLRNDTK